MTFSSAQEWARSDAAAADPSLATLERVAFQRHPLIVDAFDGTRGEATEHAARRRLPGSGWLWLLLALVMLFAPLLGVAIYGEHRYLDLGVTPASTSIPVSGLCFAVTLLIQLALAIGWVRGGAVWSTPIFGYAAVSGTLAVFATFGVQNVARDQGHPGPGLWLVPIVAAAVAGCTLALANVVRIRAQGRGADPRLTGRRQVKALVQALPASERRMIKQDRNAAVDILAERGFLGDLHAQTATGQPLGNLTWIEQYWKDRDERSDS